METDAKMKLKRETAEVQSKTNFYSISKKPGTTGEKTIIHGETYLWSFFSFSFFQARINMVLSFTGDA